MYDNITPREYFYREYAAWRSAWEGRQYPDFNNEHFRNIVDMGYDAIPFIINLIKMSPNHVVHALDLIIGEYTEFKGYASLKTLCAAWISVYEKIKPELMKKMYGNHPEEA